MIYNSKIVPKPQNPPLQARLPEIDNLLVGAAAKV